MKKLLYFCNVMIQITNSVKENEYVFPNFVFNPNGNTYITFVRLLHEESGKWYLSCVADSTLKRMLNNAWVMYNFGKAQPELQSPLYGPIHIIDEFQGSESERLIFVHPLKFPDKQSL